MSDKVYLGSGKVVQTQHGPMLKFAFCQDDINKLQNNMNQQGWVNVNVGKKRDPVQGKPTHYMKINDWQPDQNQGGQQGTQQGGQPPYQQPYQPPPQGGQPPYQPPQGGPGGPGYQDDDPLGF